MEENLFLNMPSIYSCVFKVSLNILIIKESSDFKGIYNTKAYTHHTPAPTHFQCNIPQLLLGFTTAPFTAFKKIAEYIRQLPMTKYIQK